MKNVTQICLVIFLLSTLPSVQAASPLPRSTPEAQGISSARLLEFVSALDEQIDGMHSVMVVRHGQVIAEGWWTPYDAEHNHVLDFLWPRLFEPLGIEHAIWETNFQGISLGGYGLRLRTEDIAKFGQLYLQKGRWNGKQLLPPEWVAMATAKQTSNGSNPASDWNQGYGFQFWRCRHNAYRGDGAFGQYCLAMPDQDAVVAITI